MKTTLKHFVLSCFLIITATSIQAQLGGLINNTLNKAANKATDKLQKKAKVNQPGTSDNDATVPFNNDDAKMDPETEPQSKASKSTDISFPVTGKKINAVTLIYGMDYDDDLMKILNAPGGKDIVAAGRSTGLTGSDLYVMKALMKDPALFEKIRKQVEDKYPEDNNPDDGMEINCPSFVFNMFVGAPKCTVVPGFVRSDLQNSENGQTSLAGMFGGNPVSLTDLTKRINYSILNTMGMQVAVTDPLVDYSDVIGMSGFAKKVLKVPGITAKKSVGTFNKYTCTVMSVEIPVQRMKDKDGKDDNTLLFIHSMLNGTLGNAMAGQLNYSPSYKIFAEAYYSTVLNAKIPASITQTLLQLQGNNGILVGFKIRDEKGNAAIYKLNEVQTSEEIDEGMFQIPPGYEVLTQEQFKQKLSKKFKS